MGKYIEFERITKTFPGQLALSNVSFSVQQAEIHAIIGENGAGKSTLLNILHGVFPQTEGRILIDGQEVRFSSIAESIAFGIAKVHQEINSIPEMTVAENLFLGNETTRFGILQHGDMIKASQKVLDRLRCDFSAGDKMGSLSTGQKQMVAISKALLTNAKIISFDEPTASLSDAEVQILFNIICELKEQGITILYISHKMDEIFALCQRATVLRDGHYISTLRLAETSKEQLIHAMVGRDVAMFAKRLRPSCLMLDQVSLEVVHLSGQGFKDISFRLHKGEILGFFGLIGAGRTEVMRVIYGANKRSDGIIILNQKPIVCKTPHESVKAGIALISENRKEEGIVPNLCNMDNIALPCLQKFQKYGIIQHKQKYDNSIRLGRSVGLTPNDPVRMTSSLSGGNAQKIILARWLSTDANVVIFDEPTKGIDIGAKAEIYRLMEDMAESGKSIIMVSSELTEIMGMSDRILVMREGTLTGELQRNEFAEDRILNFAIEGELA